MDRAGLAALLATSCHDDNFVSDYSLVSFIFEKDAREYRRALAGAVAGGGLVVLGDPAWSEQERAEVQRVSAQPGDWQRGWLLVPTGGSSGKVKLARHDQDSLAAAVNGFLQHFGLRHVNAVGVLPLHHVSGLMAWVRCALSGGEYRPLDWKGIEAGELPALPTKDEGWVISLVPTQLERLLRSEAAVTWLRGFRIIFLGGAAAAPALLDKAAERGLRMSLGYGMTESAAMVTGLAPEEFLNGRRDCGRALPHARVSVGADGLVRVAGASVFRGYYPQWRDDGEFVTADLGEMDKEGRLKILGRADGVIISGGEKILPSEVESVLRSSGQFQEAVVVGVPDPEWGERVVAAYPAVERPDLAAVNAWVESRLSAWKRPKRYVPLSEWPRTAAGKVNRAAVAKAVREHG